jgi:hypothetical protein
MNSRTAERKRRKDLAKDAKNFSLVYFAFGILEPMT